MSHHTRFSSYDSRYKSSVRAMAESRLSEQNSTCCQDLDARGKREREKKKEMRVAARDIVYQSGGRSVLRGYHALVSDNQESKSNNAKKHLPPS